MNGNAEKHRGTKTCFAVINLLLFSVSSIITSLAYMHLRGNADRMRQPLASLIES
jgi:hypothetical protein